MDERGDVRGVSMDNVKIYNVDDSEWIASKLNKKETIKWYNEEFSEYREDEALIENDIDDEMWFNKHLTDRECDIIKWFTNDDYYNDGKFMVEDDEVWEFVTYKFVIEYFGYDKNDDTEPFIIATENFI